MSVPPLGRRSFALGALATVSAACAPSALAPQRTTVSLTPAPPLMVCGYAHVIEIAPALLVARENPTLIETIEGGLASLFPVEDRLALTRGRIERDQLAADLACQAETVTLRVSLLKPELRLIMVLTEGDYRIIARRSAGITSLQDLRGKRVATLRETSSDYFLHLMLQSVGLSHADIEPVSGLQGAQGVADAIINGEADAITIWEPEAERVVNAFRDDIVSFSNPDLYRERYGVHATTGTLADPVKRRQIVQFLAKVFDASKTCTEDPGKVIPISAARSGFDEELLRGAWPSMRFPAHLSPDLVDVMVAEEEWLAHLQKRQRRVRSEIGRLIDDSVLQEARELAGGQRTPLAMQHG